MIFPAQERDVLGRTKERGEDEGVCTMRGLGALLSHDFAVAEGMMSLQQQDDVVNEFSNVVKGDEDGGHGVGW